VTLALPSLPPNPTPAELDALTDEPARWLPVLESLARTHGLQGLQAPTSSTVLVGLADHAVIKLYPPFLRDHFAFEHAALAQVQGRLSLPTPELQAEGEHEGWPYLVMSRLPGRTLEHGWADCSEAQKCVLLHTIGRVAAELHALPVAPMQAVAPRWPEFLHGQRERCEARQRRTGLPPHLLDQLGAFLQGPVPEGPDVMLTGEFTPFNLLAEGAQLSGMIDFGDGLVGPREYDWLGPLCFFVEGQAARAEAFFAGYGLPVPRDRRDALLRLLLLHRYSHLPAQMQMPDWQRAKDFTALARHWLP
jgi:hygromycin-B 7''-O-kinase